MTRLIFYGGAGEVGGNKIYLEDQSTRIFLDFGKSFSQRSHFFDDPFLVPRELEDLLELGLIDPLDEVYKIRALHGNTRPVDGILLSHVHADHADHISLIHPVIPVYLGQVAKLILDSFAITRYRQMDNDTSELRFRTFRTGDRFKIGSIGVEPIHVDHSIPGAYGFILHTTAGPIVYTGDFRLHGPKRQMSLEFVARAKEVRPVAMISEGTNTFSPPNLNEEEIQRKLEELIAVSPGLVMVSFLFKDIDRYRSIFQAAKTQRRKLVISLKHAHFLRALRRDSRLDLPPLDDPDLRVLVRRRGCFYDWETELRDAWEKTGRTVTAEGIAERQPEFLLTLSNFELPELVRIKPMPGSIFVMSMTEPTNEEAELDYDRLTHWLTHFGLPLYSLHASGHILPHDLRWVVQEVQPKELFLIHSEAPALLARYLSDVASVIRIPQRGEEAVLVGS